MGAAIDFYHFNYRILNLLGDEYIRAIHVTGTINCIFSNNNLIGILKKINLHLCPKKKRQLLIVINYRDNTCVNSKSQI